MASSLNQGRFWDPFYQGALYYFGDLKRDHNFENYPHPKLYKPNQKNPKP